MTSADLHYSLPRNIYGHTLHSESLAWDVGSPKSIEKCPGFAGLTSIIFCSSFGCDTNTTWTKHNAHTNSTNTQKKAQALGHQPFFGVCKTQIGWLFFLGCCFFFCCSSRARAGNQLNFKAHGLQVDTCSHTLHANAGTPQLDHPRTCK